MSERELEKMSGAGCEDPMRAVPPWWQELDQQQLIGSLRFVSGEPDGDRLRLRYYLADTERTLAARVWFGPGAAGPPGHAHGGSIAAVFDEVLGLTAWVKDYPIVVANLNVNFRNALPLNTVTTLMTRVESIEGKKISVRGELRDPDGTLYADGTALLLVIGPDKFAKKAGV